MKISEKIYRLRTENDLTQVQFSKIAGVSDKAVSTWERGEKEPRVKPLQKICSYFDIDINQFADTETNVYKKIVPESSPSAAVAQIMDIVRQMSPEEQGLYLENLRTLRRLQEQGRKPGNQG